LEGQQKIATTVTTDTVKERVTLFLDSRFIELKGNWHWNLMTDAIFCSDVMLSIPFDFVGTKALIHPDDVHRVKKAFSSHIDEHINFRIITTYGEVIDVIGDEITLAKNEREPVDIQQLQVQVASHDVIFQKEYESLQLINEIYETTERYSGTGIWFYNSSTNQTWYSNHIFRIFDLPPQSLNAHLHTFAEFIHPDDREAVIEYIDKAYRKKTPLHIEYRITTPVAEKTVLYISNWITSSKGELVLSGSLQNITAQKQQDNLIDAGKEASDFYSKLLMHDEQAANLGHWHVNLLTRKTTYSDNYYRIFGLRPQSVPAGINGFANYIYRDDRDVVFSANKKMMNEHAVPEMEYRITRSDGKMRYIIQKAKLITHGHELIVAGTIQDVTRQRLLENKLKDLAEADLITTFVRDQSEELAGMATWVWELETGKITWSDNFYKLLGYKSKGVEMSQKLFVALIHPDDQKTFTTQRDLAIKEKQDGECSFRCINRGVIRYLKCSFKVVTNLQSDFFIATLQDVTDQETLQQQLDQRVQQGEILFDNIYDRVIITDLNNNIILWNKPCEEAYGIAKDDAINHNFFDVLPKLKTEEQIQLFKRVLSGEKITQHGIKAAFPSGYYDLHMLPLWNENDAEVKGIIHIIHDVTKETELRKDLNERLSFISSLIEASVDRLVALDKNMNYIYCNERAEKYYGLKKDAVIGKNILEITPAIINDGFYEELRMALKGETIHRIIENLVEENEQFDRYLIPIKNDKNEVAGILWMEHGISQPVIA
jgi:PAS domain S-box-containing protein